MGLHLISGERHPVGGRGDNRCSGLPHPPASGASNHISAEVPVEGGLRPFHVPSVLSESGRAWGPRLDPLWLVGRGRGWGWMVRVAW